MITFDCSLQCAHQTLSPATSTCVVPANLITPARGVIECTEISFYAHYLPNNSIDLCFPFAKIRMGVVCNYF